jgi:dipeptidyl aminopeptidase/acylaminoacyl peptidase
MRLLSRTLTVVCVLSAAGFAAEVSPALGAFPGENGRIAFDSTRDGGDADIWTMNPDGSNPVNLTPGSAADDSGASWSADGRQIVFVSNRETPKNPAPPENPTPPTFPGPGPD